jgi:predicted transcriptional regulator
MKNFELAKKICKEHGVKGFRKLKLKRTMFTAGKQCQSINAHIAKRLIDRLLAEGFEIRDAGTCYELADKGLLDTVTVC